MSALQSQLDAAARDPEVAAQLDYYNSHKDTIDQHKDTIDQSDEL